MPVCSSVAMVPRANNTILLGSRDVYMEHIASYLSDRESQGRPVVDRTGLSGTFDFSINWSPAPQLAASDSPLNNSGTTFDEALHEQLGLKLKPGRAPIRTLVIDHVEQLSPN